MVSHTHHLPEETMASVLAGHICLWVSPKQRTQHHTPCLFCKQYNLQGLLYILNEKLSQQQISKWDISAKAFVCSGVELFFIQQPVFSNSNQVKDTQTHTHLFASEDCRWCRISGILNNRDLNLLIYMVTVQKNPKPGVSESLECWGLYLERRKREDEKIRLKKGGSLPWEGLSEEDRGVWVEIQVESQCWSSSCYISCQEQWNTVGWNPVGTPMLCHLEGSPSPMDLGCHNMAGLSVTIFSWGWSSIVFKSWWRVEAETLGDAEWLAFLAGTG